MNNCRYARGLLLWPLHACVDKAGGVRNPLPFASTSLHGTLPNGLAKGKACQSPVQNLLHRWTPSVAAPWRTVSSPSCVNGFPCFYQISLTLGLGFFLSLNIKRQYQNGQILLFCINDFCIQLVKIIIAICYDLHCTQETINKTPKKQLQKQLLCSILCLYQALWSVMLPYSRVTGICHRVKILPDQNRLQEVPAFPAAYLGFLQDESILGLQLEQFTFHCR